MSLSCCVSLPCCLSHGANISLQAAAKPAGWLSCVCEVQREAHTPPVNLVWLGQLLVGLENRPRKLRG